MKRMPVLFLAVFAVCLHAQTAKVDVASVKPSAPETTFCSIPQSGALQLTMRGCALSDYLRFGWGVRSIDLVLPPNQAWISSSRYDLTAKLNAAVAPADLARMLLPPILSDRFRAKFHHETHNLPVFYLSPLKSGLKLSATKPGSCMPWDKKGPPPPPDPNQIPTCDYALHPVLDNGLGLGIEGTGVPMASLASDLSRLLDRQVIDRTGYTGTFDIHLKFTRESVSGFANRGPNSAEPDATPTGLPSIFTAIKTLGISLESGKAPVDVFVVDSAQRPTEN